MSTETNILPKQAWSKIQQKKSSTNASTTTDVTIQMLLALINVSTTTDLDEVFPHEDLHGLNYGWWNKGLFGIRLSLKACDLVE